MTDAMGTHRLSTFSYDNAQNREAAFAFGVTDDPIYWGSRANKCSRTNWPACCGS